jgi:hypothetical protein
MTTSSDKKQSNIISEEKDFSNVTSFNTFGQQQDKYEQINQHFQKQNEGQKTIQEAREILGDAAENLTDSQINDLVNEIQYLVDTWIDEYEENVFDGKTLKELLQINV